MAKLEAALAKATEEPRLVAIVAAAAARGDWRASAWILSRRWPERWGTPQQRRESEIPEPAPTLDPNSPFYEIDELASRRRRGS
jgi:hypothetical protein